LDVISFTAYTAHRSERLVHTQYCHFFSYKNWIWQLTSITATPFQI